MNDTKRGSGDADDSRSGSGFQPLKSERRIDFGVLGAIVAAVVMLIFILQNTEEQEVTWLFFDATAPLWVVILLTAGLAIALAQFVRMIVHRRKRRTRKSNE